MRTGRILKYLLAAFIFPAFLISGCFKSFDTETTVSVVPWIQVNRADTMIQLEWNIRVFAHYVQDTTEWEVKSYEDASKGIITNRNTGNTKEIVDFEAMSPVGEQDGNGIISFGPLREGKLMLVVYDSYHHNPDLLENTRAGDDDDDENGDGNGEEEEESTTYKMYAYRGAEIIKGLESVRIPVIFRLWETRKRYVDSRWNVVNDHLPEPQPEEDDE